MTAFGRSDLQLAREASFNTFAGLCVLLLSCPRLLKDAGRGLGLLNLSVQDSCVLFASRSVILVLCLSVFPSLAPGQSRPENVSAGEPCTRPAVGSVVQEPVDLRSHNGILKVALAFRSSRDSNGNPRYCYVYQGGLQSPNLRVHPGDLLILEFANLSKPSPSNHHDAVAHGTIAAIPGDPCAGGVMTSLSTNLHFHGMVVPPT